MYWEGIEVTPGITAIEWAERLTYKPLNYLELKLEHCLSNGRQATMANHGEIINLKPNFLTRLKEIEPTNLSL